MQLTQLTQFNNRVLSKAKNVAKLGRWAIQSTSPSQSFLVVLFLVQKLDWHSAKSFFNSVISSILASMQSSLSDETPKEWNARKQAEMGGRLQGTHIVPGSIPKRTLTQVKFNSHC